MLTDDDYRVLAARCRERGIAFGASVFDERGLNLLDELGAAYTKIASCDLNHSRLLIEAAQRGRRLIISTGMANLGEIERAVADVTKAGGKDVVLMHCVSEYPCPTERMNLAFIKVLQAAFGLPVGLSDHTENSLAAAAAVAMGVTWIEKHLALDRAQEGFDHAYAMEPKGLAQFVCDVGAMELACRRRAEKVGPGEAGVRTRARRALYAARDLAAGETLGQADVLIVRPEGPLAPNDVSLLVGRQVRRPVRRFEPLTLEMV
jgi:sialic acid synthase SpsE